MDAVTAMMLVVVFMIGGFLGSMVTALIAIAFDGFKMGQAPSTP